MSIVTTCKRCGAEFEADRIAILAGPNTWRLCPSCRNGPTPPQPPALTSCVGCGRTLKANGRRLCARCLGVSTA